LREGQTVRLTVVPAKRPKMPLQRPDQEED